MVPSAIESKYIVSKMEKVIDNDLIETSNILNHTISRDNAANPEMKY
jgi:hypothetical protein